MRFTLPKAAVRVPCPECGEADGHLSLCRFSLMKTGKVYVVVAIPVEALGQVQSKGRPSGV